jgi:hypothetical protein
MVTVGSFGVVATAGDDVLPVASTFVHPAYNAKTLENGFAIILLTGTSDLEIVELNPSPTVPTGEALIVMGQGNILPGNLRTPSFLTSTVVQTSDCTAFHSTAGFPAIATSSQFCVGNITKGFCDEDWGGPLILSAPDSAAVADL